MTHKINKLSFLSLIVIPFAFNALYASSLTDNLKDALIEHTPYCIPAMFVARHFCQSKNIKEIISKEVKVSANNSSYFPCTNAYTKLITVLLVLTIAEGVKFFFDHWLNKILPQNAYLQCSIAAIASVQLSFIVLYFITVASMKMGGSSRNNSSDYGSGYEG